ncbi:MAG: hypothetical protein JWP94_2962 [Mucilaginibacter sp.]|nr:hypothetical protein [Mucilaginibacter sp.]
MITLATFDILDKELTRDVSSYLAITDDYRWKNSQIEFQLDPSYWNEFYAKLKKHLGKFAWKEFKYSVFPDLDKTITTDDIGIYLFVIRPEQRILDLPQFIMYVGIAGEGGSNRPLKTRLSDYYNINNIRKRKKLHSMLKKYYNNTWVIYSLLPTITYVELEQLEVDLHGFFIPPANERDFPVKIKNIIKAQFIR